MTATESETSLRIITISSGVGILDDALSEEENESATSRNLCDKAKYLISVVVVGHQYFMKSSYIKPLVMIDITVDGLHLCL